MPGRSGWFGATRTPQRQGLGARESRCHAGEATGRCVAPCEGWNAGWRLSLWSVDMAQAKTKQYCVYMLAKDHISVEMVWLCIPDINLFTFSRHVLYEHMHTVYMFNWFVGLTIWYWRVSLNFGCETCIFPGETSYHGRTAGAMEGRAKR